MSDRVIAGIQPVREAVRAHGKRLAAVYVLADGGPRVDALARFAEEAGVTVERTGRNHIDKLSGGASHQGAVALAAPLEVRDPADIAVGPDTLVVVLDGITDPQNFGAVIRSAVALGATGVMWGEHHAAPLTTATFRASAGSVEHAALYRARSLRASLGELAARGVRTIALAAGAGLALADAGAIGPVALVIGSEDRGVTRGVKQACAVAAELPMTGPIGSLNASVAAAIAVYEIQGQRRKARAMDEVRASRPESSPVG
jgi:23S rRNA (guanosine2251-2'-O)-methyltransferase